MSKEIIEQEVMKTLGDEGKENVHLMSRIYQCLMHYEYGSATNV